MVDRLESRIALHCGDITKLNVQAVVTAANEALRGGGGVDGAVHRAAGPKLVRASMALAPCPAGESRITEAFSLPARFVIHTVGPIFHDLSTDAPVLASAYQSALALAAENELESIAFPCISTGAYGFPPDAACEFAIQTVLKWLNENTCPQLVTFCCFEAADHERYLSRLTELGFIT